MKISQPRGIVPKRKGCELPAEYAEIAENMDLSSGRFQPWRTPLEILKFPKRVLTAHVRDCCWTGDSDPSSTYVDAGVDRKTYWSNPTRRPWVTDSICDTDWSYLGYPVPDAPVVYSDLGVEAELGPNTEYRTYVITYGTECEEGPASCPSDPIKATKESLVGIRLPPPPDPMWSVQVVRVYQSVTQWDSTQGLLDFEGSPIQQGVLDPSASAQYYLVAELPYYQSHHIVAPEVSVGPQLVTQHLLAPPECAQVAGETERSSLVIFWDKTVAFSERNCHWGFPLRTWHDFPYDIKDVKVCGDTVFVLTKGAVYVIQDTVDQVDASARQVQEVKGEDFVPSPCLSCAVSGNAVWYTSPSGLVRLDVSGSGSLVSRPAFGKDEWMSLGPIRSLTIGMGMVILSTRQDEYVWEYRLDDGGNLPADLTTLSFSVDQWLKDDQENIYFLADGVVYQFNAGDDNMSMTWRQAEQRTGDRQKISALGVDYIKKDTPNQNVVSVYRGGQASVHKAIGHRPRKIRNTATDCLQIQVKGTEPMCSVSYGQGLNSLSGDQR